MQHLGTEDELKQVWRDIFATMSPEERLRGLAPEELERLRQLLQSQTKADNPSRPE